MKATAHQMIHCKRFMFAQTAVQLECFGTSTWQTLDLYSGFGLLSMRIGTLFVGVPELTAIPLVKEAFNFASFVFISKVDSGALS